MEKCHTEGEITSHQWRQAMERKFLGLNIQLWLKPILSLSCLSVLLWDLGILGQLKASALPPLPYTLSQVDSLSSQEVKLLEKINQIRIKNGLEPLFVNPQLTQIARDYSQYMAEHNCFSHDCKGYGLEQDFLRAGMRYASWTENLGKGYISSETISNILQNWLNDPPHRENILNSSLSQTGIGIWSQGNQVYVTQLSIQPVLAQTPSVPRPSPVATPRPPVTTPRSPQNPLLNRETFEAKLRLADPTQAVNLIESSWLQTFKSQLSSANVLGATLISAESISNELEQSNQETRQRSALLYVVALKDQINLYLVLPNASDQSQKAGKPKAQLINHYSVAVPREKLLQAVKTFNRTVRDPRLTNTNSYLASSQQLYHWLISPFLPTLRAKGINNLIFSLDDDLRTLPLAALHDGRSFLIEQYSIGLIPSFGLTNRKRINLKTQPILAMGISESVENQPPLPGAGLEVNTLSRNFWVEPVQKTLNQDSTLQNFQTFLGKKEYGIIHLATHASFRPGSIDNSFIQFWNQRLTFKQIAGIAHQLQWTQRPIVELLVLSACQTAVGNREAELGFAGLAIQSGVKSAVASLWSINDQATVGIMLNFYKFLLNAPTKAAALRQAQLAMLRGDVKLQNNQLILSADRQVPWPETEATKDRQVFSHPHFWAAYTLVGNWK